MPRITIINIDVLNRDIQLQDSAGLGFSVNILAGATKVYDVNTATAEALQPILDSLVSLSRITYTMTRNPSSAAEAGASTPIQYLATTTNATPTTIATVAIPLGKTVLLEVKATGDKADFSQGAAYIARAAFKNNAGVVTQIGSSADDFVPEDDPSWTGPDFAIVGTNVLVKVIGKVATTINWVAELTP